MSVIIITGSGGLIGSASAERFLALGYDVIGIDNDSRAYFFGASASTNWMVEKLKKMTGYQHFDTDIRNFDELSKIFHQFQNNIAAIIHCAAQPSHDWASKEPLTDFTINALGTLNLLEVTRKYCAQSPFVFMSTNKVYGDAPNLLPLVELDSRWEINPTHEYAGKGISESLSIDQNMHSVFGASKASADIMVQEYGRYFGMNTVCFRGGCLTGPAHSAAELHGFLGYLVKCAVDHKAYTIFGYKGKQVRDNIHSEDVVSAFEAYIKNPKPAAVYNLGGGIENNCSMHEAISIVESFANVKMQTSYNDLARKGDHIWYVSDLSRFKNDYPHWQIKKSLKQTIQEMVSVALDKSKAHKKAA